MKVQADLIFVLVNGTCVLAGVGRRMVAPLSRKAPERM